MHEILIQIIPGVAFACAIFLFLLSFVQFRIYRLKKYQRSLSIALFCLFAGFFALEHFIAQSRAFSPQFTHFYVVFSTICLCFSLYYYMKSLSYFLAIPNLLFKIHTWATFTAGVVTLASLILYLLTDVSGFFHPGKMLFTGNYFVDSYTTRIGHPHAFINIILSSTGVITVFSSAIILRIVLKSVRDFYFIVGLGLSIFAATIENFFLPFTYEYFVPIVFLSNLFEAFRMNSLSYREYLTESLSELSAPAEEKVETTPSEKYQNSNLSEQRISALATRLNRLLREERVYINPNLNSEDLARKLGIPTYQLSQVVNIGLNTNFFELLSMFRIEEVKKRLQEDDSGSETIINIAYSSGFNSKSAFNTAFKKQTGLTPSAYRKQIMSEHKTEI